MSEIPWNSICHRVFLIYLRLSRNQGQEWSPVTISSLAKIIVGVNRMVVENVEIEYPEINPTLIISVRPTKKDSCRCGICGKKCRGYDQGNGKRRWRSLDIGNSYRVYLESDSPRVWCREHGAVVQMVPWARHGSKHTKSNWSDTSASCWTRKCRWNSGKRNLKKTTTFRWRKM